MTSPTAPGWRELTDAGEVADALADLFETRGDRSYSEAISQTDHARQVGAHAMAARQTDATVVAAFLHDIGHLLRTDPAEQGVEVDEDRHHEVVGARFLANWFDASVTTPIALHVPAKRFLCAVQPSYLATLSPASVRSLELQGGPMTKAEVAEFERHPEAETAVALRRWDDLGKEPGAPAPSVRTFREIIAELVVTPEPAPLLLEDEVS